MKQAMSAFDLRAIAHEMQAHLGAWVKKSYMPSLRASRAPIQSKDADAFDLVIVRGRRISTSTRDRPMPMSPPPFAMLLRKQLGNARLIAVEQLAFDRLLRMTFTTKAEIAISSSNALATATSSCSTRTTRSSSP